MWLGPAVWRFIHVGQLIQEGLAVSGKEAPLRYPAYYSLLFPGRKHLTIVTYHGAIFIKSHCCYEPEIAAPGQVKSDISSQEHAIDLDKLFIFRDLHFSPDSFLGAL